MKLEVGKKYVLRNGEVRGPLQMDNDKTFCFFDPAFPTGHVMGHKNYWKPDGKFSLSGESDLDIVSEYTEPAPPLQWKWMKPDRPGIWAWGGSRRNERVCNKISNLSNSENTSQRIDEIYVEGWWCFICDVPFIAEPTKQRVMKHLWVRRSGNGPRDIETEWSEKCPGDNWYCSSLAEEFEE